MVKAALDIYLQLQLWEEVIACYTILELRHKVCRDLFDNIFVAYKILTLYFQAAEIIQQQIDVKPTVKLYCLLGDATGN